jgi:PAS domain S-box-containing protein
MGNMVNAITRSKEADFAKEIAKLKRLLDKEQKARLKAEAVLDQKSEQLQRANVELESLKKNLESSSEERSQALANEELRYRQIVETASDVIYRANKKGCIIYANQIAISRLGYPLEEIIGKHFLEFIHPDWREQVRKFYRNIRDSKQADTYLEVPILTKSGETRWLGQNVKLIFDKDNIVEAAAVARDITKRKETEDALLQTQLRLTNLVANLQSGILVEDENGRIVLTNQLFCSQFGITTSPEELIGFEREKLARQLKSQFENPNQFIKDIEHRIGRKKIKQNEKLQLADGRIFERDFIPIFVRGKYMGNLWQYRNITYQVKAEDRLRRSEEKYRGIIENMDLGLMEVDVDGIIIRAYQRFCDMTGYTAEELIGKKATDILVPPEYLSVVQKQMKDRMKGNVGVYEVQLFKRDGSRMWALISGAPIFDAAGNVCGSIWIHYDISKQRYLQQELFVARLRAEEAKEAEKQFLANMSHEIRTPLNAIIGMTHLLFDTSPSHEQTEYLDVLKSSADILQALINDILDLAKIRAGKMELNPKEFDLTGLVNTLVKIFQRKLDSKPVQLEASIDPSLKTLVVGDDLMLNQILMNLLGNAEKFTKQGHIGVLIVPERRDGNRLTIRFEVSDTGIGIPEDKIDLIFSSFRQVDGDITRNFGGTGLGLTIVQNLIELQEGSIEVKSKPGYGTTFIFKLTYEDTGRVPFDAPQPGISSHAKFATGCRLLVVEDNFMNRKYISTLMKKWNLPYRMAGNGKEGLKTAQQERFDLIFLDIQMPEMDGYETAEAIRNSLNPNQYTPLIALTATAMPSWKELASQAGFNDYLQKPFNPEQLNRMLSKYLNTEPNSPSAQAGDASSNPRFSFSAYLDATLLQELYGNDLDYAFEIFEAFFVKMEKEYPLLRPTLNSGDFTAFSKLAHKLKPAFPMVGLSFLESWFQSLEDLASSPDASREALYQLLKDVEKELERCLPVVNNERVRLQAKVKTGQRNWLQIT